MRPPLPVPSISRRAKIIIGVVVLLVIILSLLGSAVRVYVDWLWFGEVGYREVYSTALRTRIFLFLLFGITLALIVGLNIYLAYRFRPPFRPMSMEQQNLERYRSALEPRLRLIFTAAAAVLGLFAGLTAQSRWGTWLMWRNGSQFNVVDPQFHRDLSYYAFTLPFQRFVLSFAFTAIVLAFLCALVVHYLFGGVRLQTPGEKVTVAARVHLSVLLGIFVLLKAVAYYLDRFELLFNDRDGRTGASYTDVNAVLPAKLILVAAAGICAIAILANIFLRNVQLPAIAIVLLLVTSIVTSGLYPAIVQQFNVRPNADQKEKEYISRNITATRDAYGITTAAGSGGDNAGAQANEQRTGGTSQVTYDEYRNTDEDPAATLSALRSDKGTIPNARLLDPNILGPTFTQFQQIRNVYGFPSKLDIDRYTVNGQSQDYVVAVRELSSGNLSGNQQNWINRHTVYTHGNGFVAAQANKSVNAVGDFASGGLPATGPKELTPQQPRIYYGELLGDYSIVGGEGAAREFDRPGSGDEEVRFTYDGAGGIKIGNMVNRLAFSVYYRERNILLSGAITGSSKILIERNPADRVQKVAPFLKIDGDPYPAVIGGRVQWIVDGYTTIAGYPYAERTTLGEVAADSRTGQSTRALPRQDVNYIRNSVKATVDAYDGTVRLYEFDTSDPVLRTWMKTYPDLIRPASEISAELRSHFRYPEDLFKVQRDLLTKYHVNDPVRFFNSQDFWRVPNDPTPGVSGLQPPFYILAQAPGQTKPTYQLTGALNALQRDNLAAYITVSSDPDTYGQIRVLELPGTGAVLGPGQVQGKFGSDSEVQNALLPFTRGNTQVVYGNLLTLPVAGGLLYVEPVYVKAQENAYPLLRKVLVAFGEGVAVGDTLSGALNTLFGSGAGAQAPDAGQQPSGTNTPTPSGSASPSPSGSAAPTQSAPAPTGTGSAAEIATAVRNIQSAIAELKAAYQSGDLSRIGAAQEALNRAVTEFERLTGQPASGTPSPTPSG